MASLLVYLMISSPERGASMLESESLRSLHRDWEQYPRGRRQGAGRLLFVSTHRLPSTTHHCLAMPRVTMSHCHTVTLSHHPTIPSSLGEKEMFAQLKAGRWGEWDDHALAGRTTLGNYWELQTHGNVWSTAAPLQSYIVMARDNMIDMITNCQYHNLTQEITTKEFSVQINETHQWRRGLLWMVIIDCANI